MQSRQHRVRTDATTRQDRTETTADVAREQIPLLPTDLTTPHAKLVYVYLWMMRRAEVTDIARATHLPQIRLYPVLDSLTRQGYVERNGSTFVVLGA